MVSRVKCTTSPHTDTDDLFDLRQSGDPIISSSYTGLKTSNGGQEFRNRYCPISMGASVGRSTGIKFSNGTPIENLFAAKGTASRWDGTVTDVPSGVSDTFSGQSTALAGIEFFPNGDIESATTMAHNTEGQWDGSLANSSNTQLRFDIVSNNAPSKYGNFGTWMSLSSVRSCGISTSTDSYESLEVKVRLRETGIASSEVSTNITFNAQSGDIGP
tara:strand:+ start:508 stop:1155 length:648 start_codon:yes stop_codon:yes gene_type:complete